MTEDTEPHVPDVDRRDVIAGAGMLGAIGLVSGTSQSATAQTATEPRIQLGDDYVIDDDPDGNGDLVVEHQPSGARFRFDQSAGSWTFDDPVTLGDALDAGGNNVSNVGDFAATSVNTETLSDGYHYAGSFDGTTADARLDNALSTASDGDVIYLENTIYDDAYTISQNLTIRGTSPSYGEGSRFSSKWTLDGRVTVSQLSATFSSSAEIEANGADSRWTLTRQGDLIPITVNADNFAYVNNTYGDITFASGTENGIVDACTSVTVTDNGANLVGDTT